MSRDQLRTAYLRLPNTTMVLMYDLTPALEAGAYITQRKSKCPKCEQESHEVRECGEVLLSHDDRATTLPLVRFWCDECGRVL